MSVGLQALRAAMGQLRLTAVHEAGHAVAHWHLNRTNFLGYPMPVVRHVMVNDDGTGLCAGSMCIYPYPNGGMRPPRLEA